MKLKRGDKVRCKCTDGEIRTGWVVREYNKFYDVECYDSKYITTIWKDRLLKTEFHPRECFIDDVEVLDE